MLRPLLILSVICLAAVPLASGATEIQIRGLSRELTTEALRAISGRAQFITGRDAIPSRADDAAFLLENFLHARGLPEATVASSIPNKSKIVLDVTTGPASYLGEVKVTGVDEPELTKQLAEQFRSAQIRGSQGATAKKIPYQPNLDGEGVADALNLLQSKGYWEATVALGPPRRDPASGLVACELKVAPGSLHKLATPIIKSTQTVSTELLEQLESVAGKVADTTIIKATRKTVEDHYRQNGYQYAVTRMGATSANGVTQLTFQVNPGQQFRVGNLEMAGVETIEPDRISKRFDRFKEKYYDEDEFNKQVNRLYGTGAFKSLQFVEHPRDDGYLDFTLHVVEGKPSGYYLYGGVGSYEGPLLGAGYYHRNLFHRLYRFRAQAEISGVGLLGEVQLADPFFLEKNLEFTTRAFILNRQNDGYDKTEAGLNFTLDWIVNDHYRMEGHFDNSFSTITSTGIPSDALGPTDYGVHVLGLTQTFDFREAPLPDSKGFLGRMTTDLGFTLGESSVAFLRAQGQAAYHWPWTEKNHFSFSLRGGTIIPSTPEQLPIDLRYFTGGANSVRSFEERKLGPKAAGEPRGGQAYWVANAEYIRGLKGPLKGVLFFDAGTLSEEYEQLFASDVELALGLGLRIDLPIGPVRFEYGYNLTQDEGDPDGAFHFSIGAAF